MPTPPWLNLPQELWTVIFNQVESTGELAKCRLVCTLWNTHAVEVLLKSDLKFSDQEAISSFNLLLSRNPDQAQYIQSISVPNTDTVESPVLQRLLDLALNPNIRTLKITMSQSLFNYFMEIVRRSPAKFDNLEALPGLKTDASYHYYDAMLYFKESLQKLELSNEINDNPVITRLGEFHRLTCLTLNFIDVPDYFVELENILGKCRFLQNLELELITPANHSLDETQFKEWLSTHIPKVFTLQKFELGEVDEPHVVEYIMHKYPQIASTVIGPFTSKNNGSAKRITDSIKNVDSVRLFMWNIQDIEELKTLAREMKSETNQLKIQHDPHSTGSGVLLDIKKSLCNDNTEFIINIENTDDPVSKEIIRLVGSINRLDMNCLGSFDWEEKLTFFELLSIVPEIESLKFTDASIEPEDVQISNLDRLTSLELCGAILDPDILPVVSLFAPNLKHLTLNTCFFGYHNRSFFVNLIFSDLEKLSIITNNLIFGNYTSGSIKDRLVMIQNYTSIDVGQRVLLQVHVFGQLPEYYVLTAGTPSYSEKVIEPYLNLPLIFIAIKSLDILNIELGALVIEMNFGATDVEMEEIYA
ncbi:hypothetical protein [Parasitella parasitica]|uniref:F-box domain-containing protein n=1 Tax=Parasitella parasitica TaxID=35722 RepID=A0A0B7NP67_9FUNG|nr:hypothetical protein [Parasitella parasitica]